MTQPTSPDLTALLGQWRQGDGAAFEQVMIDAHHELRRMAERKIKSNGTATLSAGDLLNEAVIKLMASPPELESRAHFFAAMSLTMRSVLVDYARSRMAEKRGGGSVHVTFTESAHGELSIVHDLLALDGALRQLEAVDPRASEVVQLIYFGGLSFDDVATVLRTSTRTVERELKFARAWIGEAMRASEK
jgi:RNA polymerase sigma factor (TIGR02999 family)